MRALASLLVALFVAIPPTKAQDLDDASALRATRAAVKVVVLTPGGGGSTGSGSMIDPRGYVLTNFHVVGHMTPESGVPGTLLDPNNRVHLATVDDARQSARPRFVGVVVRGDVRLDLALVRIVADADGNPLREASFPTVPLANTRALRPGSRVWAFGFPLGVRTINVTQGSIAGFQMNAREDVAWLRSDAEFNPGNSGGMLVDARGQLVAVPTQVYHGRGRALEPVELARPVERIPAEWIEALRRGHVDDVRITGVAAVGVGRPVRDVAFGDHGALDAPDQHFYTLTDVRGPARVRTDPPLPVALLGREGVIREGRGAVELAANDPPDAIVSVLVPNAADEPIAYTVGVETDAGAAVAAAPSGTIDFSRPTPSPTPTPATTPPNPFDVPTNAQPAPATTGFAIRGALVDGTGGRPVSGAWVFVGRPDADLQGALSAFLQGRISEQQLDTILVGVTRSDVRGLYAMRGLPEGRFPFALVAEGYRPQFLTLTLVDPSQPDVDLGPVRLAR
jgi:S1-C subfamily serine protease